MYAFPYHNVIHLRKMVTCKPYGYDVCIRHFVRHVEQYFAITPLEFVPSKCFPLPHSLSANISLAIFHYLKHVSYNLTISVTISIPFGQCLTTRSPLSHHHFATMSFLVCRCMTACSPSSHCPFANTLLSGIKWKINIITVDPNKIY